MPEGTVKWFDKDKGYGFIAAKDGYDIYVHVSLTFEVSDGEKGPMAINVIIHEKR
jgi:CspA family cold shock protein